MNRAKNLIGLVEQEVYQHGFDFTGFESPEDWKRILRAVGIPRTKPDRAKERRAWIWKGPGIEIVTSNDPISGKYGTPGGREDEPGYAGYIGLSGDEDKVMKAVGLIKGLAFHIKDESPGSRDFI